MFVGNNNKSAHLYSIRAGKPKYSFTSHADAVNTVGFYDSKKCFTGSSDMTIKLWDLNKGNMVQTMLSSSKCFCSTTDGYLIYTGHNDGHIKLWNGNSGQPVVDQKLHSGQISSLVLSSDQKSLVSISKNTDINIFDMRMQKVVKSIDLSKLSLPYGKIQFDVDREMSRLFIGDSTGNGKVLYDNEDLWFVFSHPPNKYLLPGVWGRSDGDHLQPHPGDSDPCRQ